MSETVKIIECPRDAWQGLAAAIPSEAKAGYLQMLIDAGFRHIDAVSFVSPTAVPQMSDSEHVLKLLQPPSNVEIIGIVVNAKGAERAVATGTVRTLGFPYSISPEFLRRNQNQTPDESLEVLRAIRTIARGAKVNLTAYISMAFGNPYGDAWSETAVTDACGILVEEGVNQISLADTVGLAETERISHTIAAAIAAYHDIEIGVHLHARHDTAATRVRAAFNAGCRRFDAAIGGLGGCPFAQDSLVGNLPTEVLIAALKDCGARVPEFKGMETLLTASAEIAQVARVSPGGK
jgi:hydroxymethylglutaryl-CoA lyase